MSESKPASVVFTNAALLANQAQQTANQAVASAAKYRTEWEEANSENLEALSTAQREFESNLAWAKSQIYEGQHQNDSAVTSLQSDMESSWNSMSTVEESLYNSASTATSEVDSHLESLRAQNSQSLADLHSAANSLHAAANSLHADADAMRSSLTAATSELGKDITSTRNSLDGVRSSLRSATSEIGNDLVNVRNSLAAVDAELRNGVKQAGADLANAKTSLTATGNSLATATSELQRQTGQISGSLSTADSMIMYNSNAIAEVKRTAGEISTTVSNIRVGGRNLLRNTKTLNGVWDGTTETVDGFTVAKATKTSGDYFDPLQWHGLTVKPNADYMLTFYAKASKQTTIRSHLYDIGDDTGYNDGLTLTTLNADYQRFVVHFHTYPFSGERQVNCIPVRLMDNVTAWIYGIQLEEGNVATQWQPAPEDTDQAISKVSQTADAIRADLTNTKGDVASVKATANSLQTQITDNKNNISSVKQTANSIESTVGQMPAKWQQAINDKASAQVLTNGVDMNNLTTAGTYLIKDFSAKNAPISAYFMATVDATADHTRVVQRVKKDDANVAYERSNMNTGWTSWERVATGTDVSSIRQTIDGITTRVSNTEGNVSSLQQTAIGLQSSVANAQGDISTLKQTASGLTSTVSNGGRNLLNNTSDTLQKFSGSNWTWYVASQDEPVAKHQIDGKTVTLSAWIENPSKEAWVQMYTDTGRAQGNRIPAGGRGWSQVTYTMPSGWSGWNIVVGCGDSSGAITLSYSSLQLEIGPNRTAWKPSNGDISSLQQTADRIQAQVNDNKGNISSVTQTANEVKTDLANTKGDVSSLRQTANKLTSDMADAKGNISSLQQTATGLQSTVQSQSGKISQLQQDADGLSATVGGAAIDVIPNLDQQFVMGYGIANTVWQDGNSYIKLPTTKKVNEVLPQTAGFALYIPWQAGKTYMQSIIFETDAKVTDHMLWTWYTSSGHMVEDATLVKLGNNTYRLIGSHTPTAQETTNPLRVFDIANFTDVVDVTTGTYLKFRNPRIWCPDDNSLAQLKLTADGLTSKVADTQGNVSKLEQTASGLQTQITNTKEDVASVKVTADSVRTDLTNANHDIASVKAKADSLTSSMANANDQISNLQQRADSITSTLSNGGRNLLSNTREMNDPSIWSNLTLWDKGDFYHDGGNDCQIMQTNTQQWNGLKQYIEVQAGRKYTFSIDAKSGDNSNHTAGFYITLGSAQEGPYNKAEVIGDGQTLNYTPTWARYSFTITATTNGYVAPRIERGTTTNELLQLARPQFEYGDTATPWQPSNGDISSLQQTASSLTSDMKDAKGNISTLQSTASGLSSDMADAKKNVSSLQLTAKELDAQIKAVDGRATTIKATADGVSARVSRIEGNNVVGSLLKLDGNEAGLGTYVNNKLIAGINTNPDGVCIEGKNIHLNGQTHIDDGVINASKITVYNTVGDNKGNQYLAVAWGQLNSTIGGKDDRGNTLWGSINQTADKFSSYYTRSDVDNKLSQQSSLISQTAENITAIVNDAKNFTTYTVSSSSTWNFDDTKSVYGNWFLNGDTSGNYVYNGPSYTWGQKLTPFMYVTSRGPKDGSRFVVTVWKDNDPTQYQRVWSDNKWSEWVILPNSQNLISAINMSPDSVKISGKNIELNGNTKVTGRLDLMQDSTNWVNQSTNYHNNWRWNNAHIYFDNYLQLQGENCDVTYTNTNTHLGGTSNFYAITTLTPGYLKFTTYNHKIGETDENFDGQITRSYLDSGRLETPEVYTDKFAITGHHIRVRDNQFLMVTNKNGTNFDGSGSVGFQVWGGIALGQQTIGSPSKDIYFQQGNIDGILGEHYSDAPKVTLHADHVASQSANTVTSKLSTKTAITKVSYDRALMAVQNTDMYDYRYTADNSGQHYVSGIIDDIHDKPEYNMDPMLINQERTARIDANLLGYHHVVLQEILKRLDKLEAK